MVGSLLKIIKDYVNEISEQTMWKERVKKDPLVLKDVPEEYITQEMWKERVKKDPWVLKNVPEEYITQDMCDSVFEKIKRISCIPETFMTLEICRKAVQREPDEYIYVPEMFSEDSEIIKAITCEVCGSKENIRKCEDCEKVVCNNHYDACWWCNGNPEDSDFIYCEDCYYECTATLCNRH